MYYLFMWYSCNFFILVHVTSLVFRIHANNCKDRNIKKFRTLDVKLPSFTFSSITTVTNTETREISELTPKRNEDSKEDGGAVIKHVTSSHVIADGRVVPVGTSAVTLRTHCEVVGPITTLYAGNINRVNLTSVTSMIITR